MPIKTFRGLMPNNTQDTIVLHTNDGSTGYRIVKFEVMQNNPGAVTAEGVVKIYKTPQTSFDAVIDFSDQRLLAASIYEDTLSSSYITGKTTIFDNEIFNQDIYVTYTSTDGTEPFNYYIELEQVKLDLNENTVATLKDIRNLS